MTTPRSPTLADVVRRALEAQAEGLHVALPARVVRFYPDRGLIDAQPVLLASHKEDGKRVTERRPLIPNVPVVFPGGGGFRFTFPLRADDPVLLVFADAALDRWLSSGREVDPEDERRHDLSDAIAIPGLRSSNAPWLGLDAAGGVIGQDGGLAIHFRDGTIGLGEESPADAVAMAARVRAELDTLRGTVDALAKAFAVHTHAVVSVSAPSGPPIPTGPGSAAPVGDVGSTTIKVKG